MISGAAQHLEPARWLGVFVVGDDRPTEPGELAGDRDRDDRAPLAALAIKPPSDPVKTLLSLPGDRGHRLLLALVSAL